MKALNPFAMHRATTAITLLQFEYASIISPKAPPYKDIELYIFLTDPVDSFPLFMTLSAEKPTKNERSRVTTLGKADTSPFWKIRALMLSG